MRDDQADLLTLEKRRQAALIEMDMETLGDLFADDLIHIHSNAVVQNKAELLDHIEQRRAFIAIDRGELTTRICGDMAVMTGRITNQMRHEGGIIELTGEVTQVMRRDCGEWRFVNFQFTPDPAR